MKPPVLAVATAFKQFSDKDSDQYTLAEEFMCRDLARSGLVPADIDARPVQFQGFPDTPAYVIPYPGSGGHWRVRLDLPEGKYRSPSKAQSQEGNHVRAYYPPGITAKQYRAARVKFICEGEKKAAALHKEMDLPAIAIGGCWMFQHKVKGMPVLIPDIQQGLKPGDQVFYIADRDILNPKKIGIALASTILKNMVLELNCECSVLVPPDPHKGVDDWLTDPEAEHTIENLEEFDDSLLFTVDMLIKAGMHFVPDKDGVYHMSRGVRDINNSMTAAELILKSSDLLTIDKYTGLKMGDMAVSMVYASVLIEKAINIYMPRLPIISRGVAAAVESHIMSSKTADNYIAEYIEGLTWDKLPRLDNWLTNVMQLGAKSTKAYANRIGKAMMCALYNRIMRPGCQQDYMFIFVGPMGIGKTTFCQTLGNFPMHAGYSMTNIERIAKDDYTNWLALKQATVLDFDELEHMGRTAQGKLKAFITRTHDTHRAPYALNDSTEPRGFIITGSSNKYSLLSDPTGARRYLMLDVADIKGVTGPYKWGPALRDQLLAEVHAKWADLWNTWWDLDIATINAAASEFRYDNDLITALAVMHDNDRFAPYEIKGGETIFVVTGSAIKHWINDSSRATAYDLGRDLRNLVNSPVCPFIIGEELMVSAERLLKGLPQDVARMYMPTNKAERIRVFPIKKR